MQITVKAKITAGWSPVINAEIVKGQGYVIEEEQFSDDLYERPVGFIPPWERTAAEEAGPVGAPDTVTTSKKKGGTE